ncbi:hypothetical protein SAMN04487948_1242 [Halogranum amylolyticum]|uniref:N-acetyltransferase domain-containing protein n=1 Tax=Halogranum amylolyticum TaxID=660520 RepID=A0A1H8W5K5_9EURY|nr:hypothetical protein [Halogranum amylolyticum]SEP22934.1 hypothetical protein SAMN04487948_1242 [Halogranum amylolyticum]
MRGISGLQGYTSIKETKQSVPECPDCGHVHEEITYNPDFACPDCGSVFNAGDHQTPTTLEYIECAGCQNGQFMYTISDDMRVIECTQCRNVVAVQHEGDFLGPDSVMKGVCNGDEFVMPDHELERIAARLLVGLAQNDDSSFRQSNPEVFEYLIKCADGQPCGYLTWNTPAKLGFPLLNQIWVHEDYRHEGHARSLVETWCTDHIDEEDMFFVESPSTAGGALFESLSDDEGAIFGKNWKVVNTM